MANLRPALFALIFGSSACSYSFSSGPTPHHAHPGAPVVHGSSKPARRTVPATTTAHRQTRPAKPARPAAVEPQPAPAAKPERVGRTDPSKATWAGELPAAEPVPKATWAGELPAAEPAPKATWAGRAAPPRP